MEITHEQRHKIEHDLHEAIEKTSKALHDAEKIVSSASFELTEHLKSILEYLNIKYPKTLKAWKVYHIIDGAMNVTFRMSINKEVNDHDDKLRFIKETINQLIELLVIEEEK